MAHKGVVSETPPPSRGNTPKLLQEGLWAKPAQDSKLIRGCLGGSSSVTHCLGFCDQARSQGLPGGALIKPKGDGEHRGAADSPQPGLLARGTHLSGPGPPMSALSG